MPEASVLLFWVTTMRLEEDPLDPSPPPWRLRPSEPEPGAGDEEGESFQLPEPRL